MKNFFLIDIKISNKKNEFKLYDLNCKMKVSVMDISFILS